MSCTPEKKTILVEIISSVGEQFQRDPFEVSFISRSDGSKPDMELLSESLLKKSKALKKVLDSSTYSLQRQSSVNPATMVEIGEDSPLKSLSTVRCVYRPTLNLSTNAAPPPGEPQKRRSEGLMVDNTAPQPGPSKHLKVMQVANRLPKGFQLPSKFSAQVQPLMENPNAVFTTSQINQGVRDIAKSMWAYTEQPTTAELQTVIKMLVSKYPHFRLTAKTLSTPESNVQALVQNLREKFNRWRIVATAPLLTTTEKKKRGRPRKDRLKTNEPGSKVPLPNEGLTDAQSYSENVKQIVTLSADPIANRSGIEVILETTFKDRRLVIKSGTELITGYIDREYPIFKLQPFLLFEMELIFPGSTNRIRQKWLELVPLIVAAAPLMRNKKIDVLLKAPRFDKIKEDFDTQSRAACELLPLCLPGTDKSVNGPRHFFDYREESADRTQSIEDIDKRTAPFIFSHGQALHLAIEKRHWFQIEGPASDAVLILLAAYHVLDLSYSPNVKPTLLFLQINLLGLVDEASGTATGTFYNMLDKERLGVKCPEGSNHSQLATEYEKSNYFKLMTKDLCNYVKFL